tara:strand:- start:34 stop:306 length:273 start_codon:yes stop_codon:yes gene_type:complete
MSTETGLENLASGQTCFGLQGIFSQPILFVSRTGFQENIANMSHIFAAVRAEVVASSGSCSSVWFHPDIRHELREIGEFLGVGRAVARLG